MREITKELKDKDCIICMNCGRIFEEATGEERNSNNCPCGMGWFNWVMGCMDEVFWGSPAANALAQRKHPFEEVTNA